METEAPYGGAPNTDGIRARYVDNGNGLSMYMLEAGWEHASADGPCLLLLHGFPELSYSWRHVMVPLARAGYHVVAPDQRGYGRTCTTPIGFDDDLSPFRPANLIRDVMGLIAALGRDHVTAVIGHDYGSPVASYCTLARPDIFRAMVLMSAPFGGPPPWPFPPSPASTGAGGEDVHAAMLRLERPRKHYQWYYSTRPADADMTDCAEGIHTFLRAYYHHKSADWKANQPFRLTGWTASELAKMPTYYVMDAGETMPETVAHEMPSAAEIAANHWLTDAELAVYAAEYGRTRFQGGLQFYRVRTTGRYDADLSILAGRSIDVPSLYLSGSSDWGVHQVPGAVEQMNGTACTDMRGVHLIDGAGHWVQQEQPAETVRLVLEFLGGL